MMHIRLAASFLLAIPVVATLFAQAAVAEPGRIIILRHGEKQDAYRLCDIGVQRSLALTTRYLGRGAENLIYGPRGTPDAFFAITLHTLELIGPTAASWRMPVIMSSVLPRAKQDAAEFTHMLNLRTQEAATEVMKNWNGKTVVMAWEHRHIADEKLVLAFPRLKVTLRQLFNLDNLGSVPKTWPGDNYDYFWIIDYDSGRLTNFQMLKQTFAAPYQNVPSNDWDTPAALPKDCEGSKDPM
jgi:hypothetical protein